MPPRPRLLIAKDEELGKRDDDFRPRRTRVSSLASSITTMFLPWQFRRRRTLSLLILVAFLCLSARCILTAWNGHYKEERDVGDPYNALVYSERAATLPGTTKLQRDESLNRDYDGPIHFYQLAKTLHSIAHTMGAMNINRNVLFAAPSTRCAANLIPMACEMAKVDRNYVHFVLFGCNTISMNDILLLNGVNGNECPVFFHDARCDISECSTDVHLEAAIRRAMKHIDEFMHPQAIITDGSAKADVPFTNAMQGTIKALEKTLIEVPSGSYEDWLWITRLHALGLSAWHKPNVEILIRASASSSGGLIRLLKSLSKADYRGLKVPRLVIESSNLVEKSLNKFITDFRWPPGSDDTQTSLMTLHYRIPVCHKDAEETSIHLVESFYPHDKENNHVLILSPHIEVSPLFLQYLHQNILEYHAPMMGWHATEDVLGLSLDVPTTLADGATPFNPPLMSNSTFNWYSQVKKHNDDDPSPFLHQGFTATATLIFGDKWAVFHNFVNHRVRTLHGGKSGKVLKTVSEIEPSWVEFLLELMRARGWSVLYPASSFVTVHSDLTRIPEELLCSKIQHSDSVDGANVSEEQHLVPLADVLLEVENLESSPATKVSLHRVLPFQGELQSISDMPVISFDGRQDEAFLMRGQAEEYATWFRAAVGGCQGDQASRVRVRKEDKTDDLFCLPGIEVQFESDAESDEVGWAAQIANEDVAAVEEALRSSGTSSRGNSILDIDDDEPATTGGLVDLEIEGADTLA